MKDNRALHKPYNLGVVQNNGLAFLFQPGPTVAATMQPAAVAWGNPNAAQRRRPPKSFSVLQEACFSPLSGEMEG